MKKLNDIDTLVEAVMCKQIALSDLSMQEMDLLLLKLKQLNQVLADEVDHEAAVALSAMIIDWNNTSPDPDQFDTAIVESQERGNTYFEFDVYTVQ